MFGRSGILLLRVRQESASSWTSYGARWKSSGSEKVHENDAELTQPRSLGGRSSVSGVVATVFGGTGMLGRAVINRLGKIGSSVIVPYRGEEKAYRHLKVMGDLGQIVPQVFSIDDEESVRAAVQRSNVVINLLGRNYATQNFSLHDVNVRAARLIAEASRDAGVERFVHVSMLGCDAEQATSALAQSKAAGEAAVRDAFPQATVLRPAEVFGGYDRFVMKLAAMIRFHLAFVKPAPGRRVQPLYISDFASALMAALAHPESAGNCYELAGPDVYTHQELLDAIANVVRVSANRGFALPDSLTRFIIANFYERFRTPTYSRDEFDWYLDGDVLESPNALNLDSLGIHRRTRFDDVSLSMLQVFQPPGERHLV